MTVCFRYRDSIGIVVRDVFMTIVSAFPVLLAAHLDCDAEIEGLFDPVASRIGTIGRCMSALPFYDNVGILRMGIVARACVDSPRIGGNLRMHTSIAFL